MTRKRQRISSSDDDDDDDDDDDAKKRQLMELPVDTLVDILLRLPAKSVGRIKCVSKTLLNMVSNISFSTLHTRSLVATNSAADQVPRLMSCFRDTHRRMPLQSLTLQSLKYENNTLTEGKHAFTITGPSSIACFPRFVFRNVFCLGTENGDCMLVNGLGERGLLRLPGTGFARRKTGPNVYPNVTGDPTFGMGFDDKTNSYKIVCVTSETDADHKFKSMTAYVLVLGTNSREMEIWMLKDFCEKQWVRYYCNSKILDSIPLDVRDSLGEWEHGIFFRSGHFCDPEPSVFFLDIRTGSINRVTYSSYNVMHYGNNNTSSYATYLLGLYSHSDTLISLKDYGELEEAHQIIT